MDLICCRASHPVIKSILPQKGDYALHTLQRLELNFDTDTVKDIRMNCQCSYAMDEKLELVQNLFSSANNLDEFVNCETAQKAGLYAKDGELYLSFAFCPCPMLAGVDRLPAVTWCYCTTGYSKVLFEKVFGCEVKVVLLKSIKTGDENCLSSFHLIYQPVRQPITRNRHIIR